MHQVKGDYPDYQSHLMKSYFHLNADQSFNPYTWKAPINWEGVVNGHSVKFTQIESDSFNENSFDWYSFPESLAFVKPYIVKAIDDAMRVMD